MAVFFVIRMGNMSGTACPSFSQPRQAARMDCSVSGHLAGLRLHFSANVGRARPQRGVTLNRALGIVAFDNDDKLIAAGKAPRQYL